MSPKRGTTFELVPPTSGSLSQRILLWFLQVFGATAVVLFGTYSVLAWKNSETAKDQADAANLMSFLSLCNDAENKTVCPSSLSARYL
jgi:hypothetical protein